MGSFGDTVSVAADSLRASMLTIVIPNNFDMVVVVVMVVCAVLTLRSARVTENINAGMMGARGYVRFLYNVTAAQQALRLCIVASSDCGQAGGCSNVRKGGLCWNGARRGHGVVIVCLEAHIDLTTTAEAHVYEPLANVRNRGVRGGRTGALVTIQCCGRGRRRTHLFASP